MMAKGTVHSPLARMLALIREIHLSGGRRLPADSQPLVEQAMGYLHQAGTSQPAATQHRHELVFLLGSMAQFSKDTAFVKFAWERLPRLGPWGDCMAVHSVLHGRLTREAAIGILSRLPALTQFRIANRFLLLPSPEDHPLVEWAYEAVRGVQANDPEEVLVFLQRAQAQGAPVAHPVQRELMRSRFGMWLGELLKMPLSREQVDYLAVSLEMLKAKSLLIGFARHVPKASTGTLLRYCTLARAIGTPQDPAMRPVLRVVESMQKHPASAVRLASLASLLRWEIPAAVPCAMEWYLASPRDRDAILAELHGGADWQWDAMLAALPAVERPEFLLRSMRLLARTQMPRVNRVMAFIEDPASRSAARDTAKLPMGMAVEALTVWLDAHAAAWEAHVDSAEPAPFTPHQTSPRSQHWAETPPALIPLVAVTPSPPRVPSQASTKKGQGEGMLSGVRSLLAGEGDTAQDGPALFSMQQAGKARFEYVIQEGADLTSSEYRGAAFTTCHLPNSHAEQVLFVDCTFKGVCLSKSVFLEARFTGCRFEGCAMDGMLLERCTLERCTFHCTSMASARFDTTRMVDCTFTACDMTGTGYHRMDMRAVRLESCSLALGQWDQFRGDAVQLEQCVMDGVILREVVFTGGSITASTLAQTQLDSVHTDEPVLMDAALASSRKRLQHAAARASSGVPPLAKPPPALTAKEGQQLLRRLIHLTILEDAAKERGARVLGNNRRRLRWASCLLPRKARGFLEALPALLEAEKVPGHADNPPLDCTPCVVHGYLPTREALASLRDWGIPHPASRGESSQEVHGEEAISVAALFTIGSTGTIAQAKASDVDLWCCYDGGEVSAAERKVLAAKCARIERWAESALGLEVHFFIMDLDAVRENRFGFSDEESSGTTQAKLLKEEFYRTAIHLAGKTPAWWYVPSFSTGRRAASPSRPPDAQVVATALQGGHLTRPTALDVVDMGHLDSIPRGEYFGAALWQMVKALKSPFKSVLKFGLLDRYVQNKQATTLLCERIKAGVQYGYTDMWEIDPYAVLFREVFEHYQKANDVDAQDLMRVAFQRKTGLTLTANPSGLAFALRGYSYMEYFFPHSEADIASHLEPTPAEAKTTNTFEDGLKLGERIMNFLLAAYSSVHSSLESGAVAAQVSVEDLTKMHRRISAFFSPRPMKLMRIPFMDRKRTAFRSLEFVCLGDVGKPMVWQVHGEPAAGLVARGVRQHINTESDPVRLCAWLHTNGMAGEATQVTAQSLQAPVALRDLEALLQLLQQFFPHKEVFDPPLETLLKPEEVVRCLLVGNFQVQREDRTPRQAALVYATSWGELFCRPSVAELALLFKDPGACLRQNLHAPLALGMAFQFHKPRRSQCKEVFYFG